MRFVQHYKKRKQQIIEEIKKIDKEIEEEK